MKTIVPITVVVFAFLSTAQAQEARDILESSGVQGGLIVVAGWDSPVFLAELRADDSYLVHGLDPDPEKVADARKFLQEKGLYGPVTVSRLESSRLPYVDNLVNLVVASGECQVASDEIARVLAPNGVAVKLDPETGSLKPETFFRKHRPAAIDEWTHYLYDASNNAVSKDEKVDPPASLQWVSAPKFARSHEHLASLSAAVTTGGRVFSFEDRGPIESIAFPPDWFLIARDAYNGLTLWKREMGPWEWHLREFRHGPPQLNRRLVAVDDRVYATLGYRGPVEAIDAGTGKTLAIYAGTEGTEEIIWLDGLLLLSVGDAKPAAAGSDARRGAPAGSPRRVLAINAASGKVLWENAVEKLAPATLGAAEGRAFYQSGNTAVAVNLKTGKRLWQSEPLAVQASKAAWYSPVLVSYRDVVLWADGKMLAGLDAATGKTLWISKSEVNWHAPPDVLVADDLVWTGQLRVHQQPGITQGLDPKTGEVKRTRPSDLETFACGMTHHRCYRNKGTPRWLLLGRAGTEYLDVVTGEIRPHHWVRGTCQYGVIPANGLLYAPPHACACYLTAKLNGFLALAPARQVASGGGQVASGDSVRFEKGPEYGQIGNRKSKIENPDPPPKESRSESQEPRARERQKHGSAQHSSSSPPSALRPPPSEAWPTYRHDASRSGRASTSVPAELKQKWQTDLGGKLSAVTIADGKCMVASIDAHVVHALDAGTGECKWTFTAGGRIDSPPTIADGLAVFGCRDGYVYCLRASDGVLVWRFLAAPQDRRIVAYGQLESLWPVNGSVLVEGSTVSFAAGRSSFLDGGIRVARVDIKTGKLLVESTIYTPDPETHRQMRETVAGFDMAGALPDVLASDGEKLFMRQLCFTPDIQPAPAEKHLFSPTGFLDDSWWHRTYWLFGPGFTSGWPGWWQTGNRVPAGRVLAFDDRAVYGFGRIQFSNRSRNAGANWAVQEPYHIFSADKDAKPVTPPATSAPDKKSGPRRQRTSRQRPKMVFKWSKDAPVRARAIVLAHNTLFLAGTPNLGNSGEDALAAMKGNRGARLVAVSVADGAAIREFPLPAPPVLDGMAAADGRLYLSLGDGTVVCMGSQ
jgi:outer membrane protein assembly factor BamB